MKRPLVLTHEKPNRRRAVHSPLGFVKAVSSLLSALIVLNTLSLRAQTEQAAPRSDARPEGTSRPAPNRRLPNFVPPTPTLRFSNPPTDAEITEARVFSEPLLKIGTTSDAGENAVLAQAITEYRGREHSSDLRMFQTFLNYHPNSGWRASLTAALATTHRQTGFFSRALAELTEVWNETKDRTEAEARTIANGVAGELAETLAHLGRHRELDVLLSELRGRPVQGPATEKISGAVRALGMMRRHPEESFRCGPLALHDIVGRFHLPAANDPRLLACPAENHGFSLTRLASLAADLNLKFRMAKRAPGAQIIVPAVVHWKVDHFSALLDQHTRNGADLYTIENPLFEQSIQVTKEALDSETTGYCLVPDGPLPDGWRPVSPTEGKTVLGKCATRDSDPYFITEDEIKVRGGSCRVGLADYDIHAMMVSLNITDVPLGYVPPVGSPVLFRLTYNQRESFQPNTFSYSNFGPKWTFDWLSYVVDLGSNTVSPRTLPLYRRGGGEELNREKPEFGNEFLGQYGPHLFSRAEIVRTGRDVYERLLPDGSKEVFTQPDGASRQRRVFMTRMVDPVGNAVTLTYDAQLRIVAATDALGQVTILSYELPFDPRKITKVTDPFGRSARFEYNSAGQLVKIIDMIGLTSEFTYGNGDFITSMTTPYGTTRFAAEEDDRAGVYRRLEITDPDGDTECVEFNQNAAGVSVEEPVAPQGVYNADLRSRNTYYWDKHAYKTARGDHSKARVFHWLTDLILTVTSGVPDSGKQPLENRVWYSYQGRRGNLAHSEETVQPNRVVRILDDGSTQQYQAQYNWLGHVTELVDPAGRKTLVTYAPNGIDVTEVRQATRAGFEVLAKITYDNRHLPLTFTGADGQTTSFTYNGRGQPTSAVNPKGERVDVTYDEQGYLVAVTGPLGAAIRLAHDNRGRPASVADREGYKIEIAYDDLNRPTRFTYPDGTFEAVAYNRLDPIEYRDRLGRTTRFTHDALGRPISMTDPLGQKTVFDWCRCGGLQRTVDPLGRQTVWEYDVAGRLVGKTLADATQTRYVYETTTSRLKQIIDPKKQATEFQYSSDDNLLKISYTGAKVPTPSVAFTHDPDYDRPTEVQDGTGRTSLTYHPVGRLGALQLASVDGPLPNDTVAYGYDALGRVSSRTVNTTAASVAYDALGRVVGLTDPLGAFTVSYVGADARPESVTYPNGQKTRLSYFDQAGDRRLKEINHLTPGDRTMSRFGYEYTKVGELAAWTRTFGDNPSAESRFSFQYDANSRLTGAELIGPAGSKTAYEYAYDQAGNRVREQIDGVSTVFRFNAVNQLLAQEGRTSKQFTYDANGNPAGDGERTFEWDAADRLTAVTVKKNRTEFTYDGFGRCVRVVEKRKKKILSDKRFVWCGERRCEERTASGDTVTRRFFAFGEQDGTTALYHTRDHLGSIRELTDATGAVQARYDYSPYGRRTKLAGSRETQFGFTGFQAFPSVGFDSALHRQYDPSLGRWLNRDPIEEAGGFNLYAYAANSPTNVVDPTGTLILVLAGGGIAAGGVIIVGSGLLILGALVVGAVAVALLLQKANELFNAASSPQTLVGAYIALTGMLLSSGGCPNPNGRKGDEETRKTVERIAETLKRCGYSTILREVSFKKGANGLRNRGADIVGINPTTGEALVVNVGLPVKREIDALKDILNSPSQFAKQRVLFVRKGTNLVGNCNNLTGYKLF